jgi:hypothetical protein
MRCFFDKRATVVDITDKEVIDLFQDGIYHHRTFEDFSRCRSSSITKLKDMITSWADEEDKANARYDSIRGKRKNNTGGNNNNNNNKDHRSRHNNNYSSSNCKCKPDNTVAATQCTTKDNSKKTSRGFKDLLKEKCPWHLDGNQTTEQCYQLRRALKDTPNSRSPHDKKGKKKVDKGNNDFQEPDCNTPPTKAALPNPSVGASTRTHSTLLTFSSSLRVKGLTWVVWLVGCRVFYTDWWGRTGGVRFWFAGPVQPKPVEFKIQTKRFLPEYRPVRPIPGRLTKKPN